MTDDPLKKWERRTGQSPAARIQAEAASNAPASDNHSTDGGNDDDSDKPTRYRLHCLELRPLNALWSFPAYSQLIDVLTDGENPSFVALVFLHQLIIVQGRNLKAIVAGLRMRTQWIIKQHSAPPAAKDAEYVESIEFITENVAAAVTALRQERKRKPARE